MSGFAQFTPNGIAGGTIAPARFVKQSTAADNTFLQCGVGDAPIGVTTESNLEFDSDNHATTGLQVYLCPGRIMLVEAGAAVTRGFNVGPDSVGRAVMTGGDGAGVALQSAVAAGDKIEIFARFGGQSGGYEAHTATDTLLSSESGSVHSNVGATGTITLNLPQDAPAGTRFHFLVGVAQALRIDPGAAGGIYINGAKQTDDQYIWADDEGESVTLTADGNGDWIAGPVNGTWTAG